jgi:hypothetical protein
MRRGLGGEAVYRARGPQLRWLSHNIFVPFNEVRELSQNTGAAALRIGDVVAISKGGSGASMGLWDDHAPHHQQDDRLVVYWNGPPW